MMISVALKAKIRKICSDVNKVINIRWRPRGSWDVWFWLARIISGRSQQVRTRSGVDKGSAAIYRLREVQPVSDRLSNQVRLASAIIRLWARVVGHSHFRGVNHVVGTSMSVGIRIFSIVGDLGFVGGRFRGCVRWLPIGLGLHLLHKLRKLI